MQPKAWIFVIVPKLPGQPFGSSGGPRAFKLRFLDSEASRHQEYWGFDVVSKASRIFENYVSGVGGRTAGANAPAAAFRAWGGLGAVSRGWALWAGADVPAAGVKLIKL